MNLGRTQTTSHVHPTPRSYADITYNRSTRYSDPEDYFGHRRPPPTRLTDLSGNAAGLRRFFDCWRHTSPSTDEFIAARQWYA